MGLENLKSIFSPTAGDTKFQDNQSDLSTFNSKFDDGLNVPIKSNLQNFNSIYDDGMDVPIKSNLQNFSTIYDNGLGVPSSVFKRGSQQFQSQFDFDTMFDDDLNLLTDTFKRNGQEFQSQFDFDTIFDNDIDIANIYIQNQPQDKFDTKFNYNEDSLIYQTYASSVEINSPILDSVLRGRVYAHTQFSQNFTNDNLFVKPESGEITEQLFKDQTFDPRAPFAKEGTLYFNTNNSFNPATNPTDFSTAGIDELSFTPLTDLGGQFQENLSWENLYNPDHTPKSEPLYKGQSAVNYGPNVSRDNLNIGTRGFNFGEGDDSLIDQLFSSDRGTEPYTISPIGDEGRDMNSGNRFLPLTRALEDVDRMTAFMKSPAGIAFIAKQNVNIAIRNTVIRSTESGDNELYRVTQRFGVTYNPLSAQATSLARLVGQGTPDALVRSAGIDLDLGILEPQEYGKTSTFDGFDLNETFTSGVESEEGTILSSLGDAVSNIIPGRAPVVPKVSKGDRMTLQEIIQGTEISEIHNDQIKTFSSGSEGKGHLKFKVDDSKEGMPFYFKDLRTSEYIFFRAYIEGLSENIAPTYSTHNYIGRSEPVYTYERAERELNFTLKLVAQTVSEFDAIYTKMEHLTSLCYPEFVDEGTGGYGHRMKAPLTRLRYGDMYGRTNDELTGFIKSLSYAVDPTSTYDTRIGHRAPRHITATITYQVIHNQSPSINMSKDNKQKFYGVNK